MKNEHIAKAHILFLKIHHIHGCIGESYGRGSILTALELNGRNRCAIKRELMNYIERPLRCHVRPPGGCDFKVTRG
jgi:hypothetical protein